MADTGFPVADHGKQARIAEDAGAAAVMALERVPAEIRRDGGVARASDADLVVGDLGELLRRGAAGAFDGAFALDAAA